MKQNRTNFEEPIGWVALVFSIWTLAALGAVQLFGIDGEIQSDFGVFLIALTVVVSIVNWVLAFWLLIGDSNDNRTRFKLVWIVTLLLTIFLGAAVYNIQRLIRRTDNRDKSMGVRHN